MKAIRVFNTILDNSKHTARTSDLVVRSNFPRIRVKKPVRHCELSIKVNPLIQKVGA